MDLLRDHDWLSEAPDINFLNEHDIDNCAIEKILQNRFHDPLISSESEEEIVWDWDKIFARNKYDKKSQVVQGLHPVPPFIKQSAMASYQHYQCLKVLCFQNPDVLPAEFMHRPTKEDQTVFEQLKETYAKEQKEFIEWAKSLWLSDHFVRALRPKPPIEAIYDAEFKVKAFSMRDFPTNFGYAAQIPLEDPKMMCEMVHQKEIIKVNLAAVPQMQALDMTEKVSVMKHCPAPEPCNKHPYRFVLPTEINMTVLPQREVHGMLAQFSYDHGASVIASEAALRCLVQPNRRWALAVSVCPVITTDGDARTVVVLGNEFSTHREAAQIRTYKALRRLLEFTLIPQLEIKRANEEREIEFANKSTSSRAQATVPTYDSDEDNLYIDTGTDCLDNTGSSPNKKSNMEQTAVKTRLQSQSEQKTADATAKVDYYNCTCKDTVFERPAQRSYRRWQARDRDRTQTYDLIVHCPHKAKNDKGDVVIEPIPEYQLDLGGSRLPPDQARALALALMLRRTAAALLVRIDSATGEIVTTESIYPEEFRKQYSDIIDDVSNRIYTAMDQLQGLMPGDYVLQHEAVHGSNALLYTSRGGGSALSLQFSCVLPADTDEARAVRLPPELAPVLLPLHKHRKILPCAFTPYANQVAREPRRPPARTPAPPPAIKWPKRKKKKKKNINS